jgi:hypothetical protein
MFKETVAVCTEHGGLGIYIIKYIYPYISLQYNRPIIIYQLFHYYITKFSSIIILIC